MVEWCDEEYEEFIRKPSCGTCEHLAILRTMRQTLKNTFVCLKEISKGKVSVTPYVIGEIFQEDTGKPVICPNYEPEHE